MTEIAVAEHPELGAVRHIIIDSDPWFILSDVAKILGYADVSKAKKHLRETQWQSIRRSEGTPIWSTIDKRVNELILMTESGLYRLMLKSQASNAEPFQIWVEDEVLPSIRRTGSYTSVPQTYAEALRAAADAVEEADRVKKELEVAQPKVEAYDQLMGSEGTASLREVAKWFNVPQLGPNKFNEFLRNNGVLYYDGPSNVPYQKHVDAERFKLVVKSIDQTGEFVSVTRVTPKGMDYIFKLLKDNGYQSRIRESVSPSVLEA